MREEIIRRRIGWGVRVTILIAFTLFCLLPFLWISVSAFKTRMDIMNPVPVWWGFGGWKPYLGNFWGAFIDSGFINYFRNSLIVAFTTTMICMFVGAPTAYAFSRFRVHGVRQIYFFILTTRMTPSIAIAIPLYFWFNKLGLLNTKAGVILAHLTFTLAFVVYLMREFFNDIPKELDESALSDGCSELQAFTKIIVPIARPGLIATFFITYMYSWNEMLIAMIIGGEAGRTLPAAFPGFVTPLGTLWGQLCAASFVVTLPIVVMMIALQKHIVRGLTMGALKG